MEFEGLLDVALVCEDACDITERDGA